MITWFDALNAPWSPPKQPNYGFDVLSEAFQKDTGGKGTGPSTYMHAVAGKGWPYDHKAEDAFDLPPRHEWSEDRIYNITPTLNVLDHPELLAPGYEHHELNETPEYKAEFGTDGSARLYLYQPRKLVGTFDTFADAQLAAEALNNLKGY